MSSLASTRHYAVETTLRRPVPVTSNPIPGIVAARSSALGGVSRLPGAFANDRYTSNFGRAGLITTPPALPSSSSSSIYNLPNSSHSSGSRSVPPGGRRPATPLGSSGGRGNEGLYGSRRDDANVLLAPRLGGPSSAPATTGLLPSNFEGRDPSTSSQATQSRSRSVAAAGNSRLPSTGSAGGVREGDIVSATCDRCDGKHPTDRCPHFHKEREKHKDAWVNYGRKGNPHQMGGSGGNYVLRGARIVRQPGDGSCLFHSMNQGLQSGTAASLRREIANFLQQNPTLQIAGDTLEEWVKWDSNTSVAEYARRMAVSGWGGGIEMVCCSALKNVNIHVYESSGGRSSNEFKRISCFDSPSATRTIHVLYQGGVHYDALQPLAS